MDEPKVGVSRWVSLSWAGGTTGSSIALGAITLLALFYLTEYVGVPASIAGILIFLSRIWDIFVALCVGQWSDRTRSPIGKRAPFLLAGAPMLAAAYVLLFSVPTSLEGVPLYAYVLGVLLLYSTGYTLFVVPYLALPAEITSIPDQRTTMMSYRVAFMTIAGLIVGGVGPALIVMFGGGRGGYSGMAGVHAAIMLVAMLGCAFVMARTPTLAQGMRATGSIWVQFMQALKDRPFRIFISVKLCQLLATATVGVSLLYLGRYILGEDESFLTRFILIQTAGTLLSLPLWSWLSRRYGKRLVYMAAGYFYAAVALSWLIALGGEPKLLTDVRIFLIGVGASGLLVLGFSILPDTMENNTKTSGVSQEGTLAAIYSMVEKGTAAIGPLVAGFMLEASGFISAAGKALPPTQPQSALIAIIILASVFPAICNVAGALLMREFQLDEVKATGV